MNDEQQNERQNEHLHENRHEQAGAADEAWLRQSLAFEAEAYSPDSERLRATVYARVDAAAGAKAGPGAKHGDGVGRRVRSRLTVRRMRLAGIPIGIATAALGTAVAVAVGVSATHGTAAAPHQTPQAGGPGAVARGSTGPESSAHAATDTTSTPLTAGQPDATTNRLSTSPSASPSGEVVASASPSASATGGSVVSATGKLNTAASNSVWAEEDIALTLNAPVSAFQLMVKVSMTPSVSSTGYWTTDNPSQFDISVANRSDGVYYTFQLKQGQTLPAGPATFAVQFNHGNGTHNPADDTYYTSVITDAAHGSASGVSSGAF